MGNEKLENLLKNVPKKKTNILFLDMDGVMTTQRTSAYINDPGQKRIDPIAAEFINHICERYDYKIVISSSWKTSAIKPLKDVGLGKHIYEGENTTPNFNNKMANTYGVDISRNMRGVEIQEWMSDNSSEVGNYLILDDGNDMLLSQKPRLIQTSSQNGITYNNMSDIIFILNQEF